MILVRDRHGVRAAAGSVPPCSTRGGGQEDWAWGGFLKAQSPPPLLCFLQQGHRYFNMAITRPNPSQTVLLTAQLFTCMSLWDPFSFKHHKCIYIKINFSLKNHSEPPLFFFFFFKTINLCNNTETQKVYHKELEVEKIQCQDNNLNFLCC